MGYKVAVAGATGAVGHAILEALDEVDFPVDEVVALASSASIGKEVSLAIKRSKSKIWRSLILKALISPSFRRVAKFLQSMRRALRILAVL